MASTQIKPLTTYLDPELVESLIKRLSRVEGHVRGVRRMLEEKDECEAILIQLSAIKAAVNQITIKLLEGHMETCVTSWAASGDVDALEHLKRSMSLVLKNT